MSAARRIREAEEEEASRAAAVAAAWEEETAQTGAHADRVVFVAFRVSIVQTLLSLLPPSSTPLR